MGLPRRDVVTIVPSCWEATIRSRGRCFLSLSFVLRAQREPQTVILEVRAAIRRIDPRLATSELRPLSRQEPSYPPQAKSAHVGGRIMLYYEIGVDGKTHVLALMNRLGYGLEDAAIAAIQRWRFEPMKKDNQPIASGAMIEVTFRLN